MVSYFLCIYNVFGVVFVCVTIIIILIIIIPMIICMQRYGKKTKYASIWSEKMQSAHKKRRIVAFPNATILHTQLKSCMLLQDSISTHDGFADYAPLCFRVYHFVSISGLTLCYYFTLFRNNLSQNPAPSLLAYTYPQASAFSPSRLSGFLWWICPLIFHGSQNECT